MRQLTLNEKITIKGKLAFYGLILPRLDMAELIRRWYKITGTSISKYPKFKG